VLTQSEQLDTATLVECARTKSQEHMLAISRRRTLPEAVTDVLVERGDQQVVLSTTNNAGAKFSEKGFGILINRAQGDDLLTRRVGVRPDLPQAMFARLLAAASDRVRATLQAERTRALEDIEHVVADVTSRVDAKTVTLSQAYAAAQALVESLDQAGQLNARKLEEFVRKDRFEEVVAGLALMAKMPPEQVVRSVNDTHAESLLMLAKAVGLSWETTHGIITLAAQKYRRSAKDIDKCMAAYERLTRPIARQILEFHRTRGPVSRQ
jgi:uncharacterized protein (DUF2336 family)